jgi:hypothetical protein
MKLNRVDILELIDGGWIPPADQLEALLGPDPEAWAPALNAWYAIANRRVTANTPMDHVDRQNAACLAYAFMFAPKIEGD